MMTEPYTPYEQPRQESAQRQMPTLIKGAIWIAIGALIAAAVVCVVWVLIGDQNGIIGKAFLTVLLLAGFAGVALLDANLASRRPDWLVLASMVSWVVAMLVGAVKIWIVETSPGGYYDHGFERFFEFVLAVGVLQLGVLHVRLFWAAHRRHVTTFTRVIAIVTTAFVVVLAGMLLFFLTFPRTIDYDELYWRIVVAVAILAAVGTTLLPLLNALFAPKKPHAAAGPYGYAAPAHELPAAMPAPQPQQAWPTYVDGRTPLPVMPDGTPDWNAYYTGYPTYPQGTQSGWQQEQQPYAPQPGPSPQSHGGGHSQQGQHGQPEWHEPQTPRQPSAPAAGEGDIPPRPPLPPVPPVV